MENVTRRSFIGGMGIAGLAAAGLTAAASVASAEPTEIAPIVDPDTADLEMLRTNTSLNELNAVRQASIDACEDYVCEDGRVIDRIWVQVRAVVDSLGYGTGALNYTDDQSFDAWIRLCNNDEKVAEAYIKSPIGKRFTPLETAVAMGIDEAEARDLLDQLTYNGMLMRTYVSGYTYYQHQRYAHGICESSMNLYDEDGFIGSFLHAMTGQDDIPFPSYYPIPLNADVVAEETVLPYDDVEGLLNRHEVFAVAPCQCRYLVHLCGDADLPDVHDRDAVQEHICDDGHHLEKCVVFGEEAQFYIDNGFARQLTRDECRELLQRQIDEDCVLQSCYTKYTEVICCCDDGCGVLAGWKALDMEGSKYANVSHYNLQYDEDVCLHCGLCAQRCPMHAIEMVEGVPTIMTPCVRCGQCAYVCPASARKLVAKEAEQIPYLPDDLLDWMNQDCMYRYEKGLWPKLDA